jgi:hypothetical protein
MADGGCNIIINTSVIFKELSSVVQVHVIEIKLESHLLLRNTASSMFQEAESLRRCC